MVMPEWPVNSPWTIRNRAPKNLCHFALRGMACAVGRRVLILDHRAELCCQQQPDPCGVGEDKAEYVYANARRAGLCRGHCPCRVGSNSVRQACPLGAEDPSPPDPRNGGHGGHAQEIQFVRWRMSFAGWVTGRPNQVGAQDRSRTRYISIPMIATRAMGMPALDGGFREPAVGRRLRTDQRR